MSYLQKKPGSLEAVIESQTNKFREDSGYQKMFKKELEKAGKGIGSMTPAEKKAFFNKIDSKYNAKDEQTHKKPAKKVDVAPDGEAETAEKKEKKESYEDMVPTKKEKDSESDKKRKQTMTGEQPTKVDTKPEIEYNK